FSRATVALAFGFTVAITHSPHRGLAGPRPRAEFAATHAGTWVRRRRPSPGPASRHAPTDPAARPGLTAGSGPGSAVRRRSRLGTTPVAPGTAPSRGRRRSRGWGCRRGRW